MSRPLSAPPFPHSPQTWLAYFRHRAEFLSERPSSPEAIGEQLGVSGATVRRWEKGAAVPTEEDLDRFAGLCGLSEHQRTFLLIAFRTSRSRLQPDPVNFQTTTADLLSRRPTPMLLMDELMYIRAWNSYLPVLGERAAEFTAPGCHPIEAFLAGMGAPDADTLARLRRAVRTFWRFSAHCSSSQEYGALVERLHEYPRFSDLWADLGSGDDTAPIDVFGVAELLLPETGPSFTVTHSVAVYPPSYSIFEYQPADEEATASLARARAATAPSVSFNPRVD